MEFEAVLEQTITLLQRQGRISYGALKRRFQLDDAYLEDLKVELIEAQQLANDENGRILVWAGETVSQPSTRDNQVAQAVLPYVERRAPDAERRQLTVMFCDLVDSTLLANQLDPEDWREVVRAYQEQLALGDTPNVAARMQGLAAPDTVVISPATFRLVRGYFIYQDLGTHPLKGLTAPVQMYRILGENAAQSRLEVMDVTGLTPLVGRDSEVSLLLERWAQSQDGAGQAMLLRGEAGMGKSRLVEVLREHVRSEGATRMVFRCSPYHQNSALYPVIDHLQRFLQWQRDESPKAKVDNEKEAEYA